MTIDAVLLGLLGGVGLLIIGLGVRNWIQVMVDERNERVWLDQREEAEKLAKKLQTESDHLKNIEGR